MARKPKVEKTDCPGDPPIPCDAVWSWVDRPDGLLHYDKPGNGLRGSKRAEGQTLEVVASTTDDYLWLFECPFCGYAESDPIEPE